MFLTRLAGLPRQKPPAEDEPDGEDNLGKYYGMFRRRAEKGQCFNQPCFGCREFPAHFELADGRSMDVLPGLNPDGTLGLMLYDVFDLAIGPNYQAGKIEAKPQITFFPAALRNGHLVEDGRDALPRWEDVMCQLQSGGAA